MKLTPTEEFALIIENLKSRDCKENIVKLKDIVSSKRKLIIVAFNIKFFSKQEKQI